MPRPAPLHSPGSRPAPRRVALRAALVLAITGAMVAGARPQALPAAVSPLAIQDLKSLGLNLKGSGQAQAPTIRPADVQPTSTPRDAAADRERLAALREAATQVLDTHCSRCHQSGRLVGHDKPGKGFDNILDLDGLAANPKYVKPGDPARSSLLLVMEREEMPKDYYGDGDFTQPTPEAKDRAAIRDWIASLPPLRRDVEVASLGAAPLPGGTPDFVALAPASAHVAPPIAASPAAVSPAAVSLAPAPVPPAVPAPLVPAEASGTAGPGLAGVQVASLSAELPADRTRLLLIETQKDLKRLGCLAGEVSGASDAPTRLALARYNAVMGRGEEATPITPELLEELRSETGTVCLPRPIVASAPSADGPVGAPPAALQVPGLERRPQPVRPPARLAHAVPVAPERRAPAAPRPGREPHLRQPTFRQAESRPAYRQAQRAPVGPSGGSAASASTASSTVSGLSGI